MDTAVSPAWTLTADGEWVLDAWYARRVKELKKVCAGRFIDALTEELERETGYPRVQLRRVFNEKCGREPSPETVDAFIIQALERDL